MRKLVTSILLVLLLLSIHPAHTDPALSPYTPITGYTYLTLGRYPQTAEGEIRPILWRVDNQNSSQ